MVYQSGTSFRFRQSIHRECQTLLQLSPRLSYCRQMQVARHCWLQSSLLITCSWCSCVTGQLVRVMPCHHRELGPCPRQVKGFNHSRMAQPAGPGGDQWANCFCSSTACSNHCPPTKLHRWIYHCVKSNKATVHQY